MSAAFATIAPIAPAAVEFHIHQVVPTFHMSIERKQYKKKWCRFATLSDTASKGTQAMKIRGVKGDSGHAHNNSKPDKTLKVNG